MQIAEILSPAAVRTLGQVVSKKRLFHEVAELAALVYGVDAAKALDALQERESLGTTGVGQGVALPHAQLHGLEGVAGVFLRLEKPLDFDAVDRQPVDLVFALLAPKSTGSEKIRPRPLTTMTIKPTRIHGDRRVQVSDTDAVRTPTLNKRNSQNSSMPRKTQSPSTCTPSTMPHM